MLSSRLIRVLGLGTLVIGAAAWLALGESDRYVISAECTPIGTLAAFRAAVQGEAFWRTQYTQLVRRADSLARWPAEHARARYRADSTLSAMNRSVDSTLRAVYADVRARSPGLRLSHLGVSAGDSLRNVADSLDRVQMDSLVLQLAAEDRAAVEACRRSVAARAGVGVPGNPIPQ